VSNFATAVTGTVFGAVVSALSLLCAVQPISPMVDIKRKFAKMLFFMMLPVLFNEKDGES
jgi:hypothetical protein